MKRVSYQFRDFDLDVAERALRHHGQVIPLPPKAFDLLQTLVEHAGEILDKEILLKTVWPDVAVEENNLSVHISAIRKALGEAPHETTFIQTLPRRGYRFIEPVTRNVESAAPLTEPAASSPLAQSMLATAPEHAPRPAPAQSAQFKSRPRRWVLGLSAALLALLVVAMWWLVRPVTPAVNAALPASPLSARPLTSLTGREFFPALSPDGEQVAFVWGGEQNDNPDGNLDIYLRLTEEGRPIRLTDAAAEDLCPRWSPDGKRLAFWRQSNTPDGGEAGIYVMSVPGGVERRIVSTTPHTTILPHTHMLNWSPDGEWLVYSDRASTHDAAQLKLVHWQSGATRVLTHPTAGLIGDFHPVFLADGAAVAFVRSTSFAVDDIWQVRLADGQERRLSQTNQSLMGLCLAEAGRALLYTTRENELWSFSLQRESRRLLHTATQRLLTPATDRTGRLIAVAQFQSDTNLWEISLSAQPANTSPLVASSQEDVAPDWSPDGQQLAFISARTGTREIWLSDREGQRLRQLTNMQDATVGSPRWSPDGQWIAFDACVNGNADLYVMHRTGGEPRRLTTDPGEDIAPAWAGNGNELYFTSSRSGTSQIWRVARTGETTEQPARQVTRQGGYFADVSTDGKWLYFVSGRQEHAVWRMPLDPAAATAQPEASFVLELGIPFNNRLWCLGRNAIFFAHLESGGTTISRYDVATAQTAVLAQIPGAAVRNNGRLALTPHEKSLLLPLIDYSASDLVLLSLRP